jgi:hypothetical protein
MELGKSYHIMIHDDDSTNSGKVMKVKVDGSSQAYYFSDEMEIDTDGEKHMMIIENNADGKEGNVRVTSDDFNWISDEGEGKNISIEEGEDGKKTIIITNEDGTTKEIIMDGEKGTYMIDEDGNLKKVNDEVVCIDEKGEMMTLEVEVDDGANTVIIKENGTTIDLKDLDESKNVWVYTSDDEPGAGEDVDVFVEQIKKKEGNETIIIKKKVILKTIGEKDQESFEKSGIDLKPGQDNTLELEKLVFAPNPSDGKFTLKFNAPDTEEIIIRIYDVNGKTVYEETDKNFDGTYNKKIDISSEGQGIYFLKIQQGAKFDTRKIILE